MRNDKSYGMLLKGMGKSMLKDILYNKISIIEKCLKRVREVYDQNPENLTDYTKQDSIVLNIQRAVEATFIQLTDGYG